MTALKTQLQEAFIKAVQAALAGMTSFGGFTFTEDLFQSQQDLIDAVATQFDHIATALTVAFS